MSSGDKERQELIQAARAVVYSDRGDQIIPSGLIDALSKAADKASALSSCADTKAESRLHVWFHHGGKGAHWGHTYGEWLAKLDALLEQYPGAAIAPRPESETPSLTLEVRDEAVVWENAAHSETFAAHNAAIMFAKELMRLDRLFRSPRPESGRQKCTCYTLPHESDCGIVRGLTVDGRRV